MWMSTACASVAQASEASDPNSCSEDLLLVVSTVCVWPLIGCQPHYQLLPFKGTVTWDLCKMGDDASSILI